MMAGGIVVVHSPVEMATKNDSILGRLLNSYKIHQQFN